MTLFFSLHLSFSSSQTRQETQHYSANPAVSQSSRLHRWVENCAVVHTVHLWRHAYGQSVFFNGIGRTFVTSVSSGVFYWGSCCSNTVAPLGNINLIWVRIYCISTTLQRAESENITVVFCHCVLLGLLVSLSDEGTSTKSWLKTYVNRQGCFLCVHTHNVLISWILIKGCVWVFSFSTSKISW